MVNMSDFDLHIRSGIVHVVEALATDKCVRQLPKEFSGRSIESSRALSQASCSMHGGIS